MSKETTEQSFNIALCEHARYAVARARKRLNGPLTARNLQVFLSERECLRYPTSIVFDRSGLEPHQFAQPLHSASKKGVQCELHVDPKLKEMPDMLYLVVEYMTAVINYGDAAPPEIAADINATTR